MSDSFTPYKARQRDSLNQLLNTKLRNSTVIKVKLSLRDTDSLIKETMKIAQSKHLRRAQTVIFREPGR